MARRKNDPAAGCGGLGCLGLGVLFLGFCGTLLDGPSSTYSPPASTYSTERSAPSTYASSETFYVHGELNVRTGPGKDYPKVRTLSRGESVRLGPKDANGWAELLTYGGTREGYVYRASDLVRSDRPSARRSAPQRARSTYNDEVNTSGATARCRDGTLSYSAHRRGTCSHHGGVATWF